MPEPPARAGRSERSGRPRPARALTKAALLTGAILTVLLGGLFFARPAVAAPARPAAQAAAANPATHAAAAAPAAKSDKSAKSEPAAPARPANTDAITLPAGGICDLPGAGDLLNLAGLCNNGGGIQGDLNNICTPSTPQPEQATAGVDSLIATPGGQTAGKTLYDNYGLAGQYWAAYGLHCSDITSLIGNNVAGMVFDMAKSLDRVTITVYQSAAGNGILAWLQNAVNQLITDLGHAIYFPFLAPVVIIGAIWLAWQGLIRKRATRTIEGTIWMVIACAAAIWLIGRPADFTGVGTSVSNGTTQVLNVAFAKLPGSAGGNCLPVQAGDPQSVSSSYVFSSSNGLVDENANELWSVLVCKPWLDGEFGTTLYSTSRTQPQTVVNQYGRDLLWSQAIAANEQPTAALITAKQQVYNGIAKALQTNDPAIYPLFQGYQWTSRMEIGFEALFAAVAAGLLVLLIALTLIVLKLGFLLLLVAGPFFLIIGTHPGFGRVIAIRWFEMLIGVLMKQVAIALVLSVLLYCYSLIMSTTDIALPWALKIMMIALVTVAVFIYRRPFQHLFSSVGYGVIGAEERAEYSWREASFGFRRASATAAGVAIPGVAAYRAARWARRNPAAAAAAGAAGPPGAGAMAGTTGEEAAAGAAAPALAGPSGADGHVTGRLRPEGPSGGDGSDDGPGGGGSGGSGGGSAGGPTGGGRGRQWPEAGSGSGRAAPPLPLPPPGGRSAPEGASAGWARGSAARATTSGRSAGSAPASSSAGNGQRSASAPGPVSSAHRSGSGGSGRAPAPPRVRQGPRPTGNGATGSGTTGNRATGGSAPGYRSGAGSGSPAGGRGWFGANAAVRSGGTQGSGAAGKRSPLPFWLRPVRRDK